MTVQMIPVTDRESWLAHRRLDLTASDVAAVAGLDPRRSPLAVYAEKSGLVEPQADSPIMRRGRWLEPAVVAAIRETYPEWTVRRAGVYLREPDWRLGATPDAVATIPGVDGVVNLQLKVVARPVYESDWPERAAPVAYEIQTMVENMLIDAAVGYVVPLVVSTFDAFLGEPRLVVRHTQAEQRAREIALDFWRSVERREPPATDWKRDGDLVEQLHPEALDGKEIDLTKDNRVGEVLDLLEKLGGETDERATEIAALEAELKAKLGDAETALVRGWRLSWKTQTRKSTFVKGSTSRVLRYRRDRE